MRDFLGPGTTLGYCTNVHAGATLETMKQALERYAVEVRETLALDTPLAIGLWLAAPAARALREEDGVAAFAAWLAERGLAVFTINGFPHGDFHETVVKHAVYRPDWADPARLAYTIDLLHVLAGLVPRGGEGSISTLPVGWRAACDDDTLRGAAEALRTVARAAAEIEAATGTRLHVDLEPEPGCVLDRSDDVVRFFETHLLDGTADDVVRRHLGVCHDVCHAAVMWEDQAAMFRRYDEAGIAVGKIQLSSALAIEFDDLTRAYAERARNVLAGYEEPRYLHQTTVRDRVEGAVRFYEDLPDALAAHGPMPEGDWRVHFHVPLFEHCMGILGTTQTHVAECLELARARPAIRHFEVETYAWDVLPELRRTRRLARDIARELRWVIDQFRVGSAA
jgi:sugar phosphate isomerase/epimerase